MNRKDFMKTAGIIGIASYMAFAVIGTIAYVSFFANNPNKQKTDSIISLNSTKTKSDKPNTNNTQISYGFQKDGNLYNSYLNKRLELNP